MIIEASGIIIVASTTAEHQVAAGIVELGEAVPGQRAGQQIQEGHADRHDEAVLEIVADRVLAQRRS